MTADFKQSANLSGKILASGQVPGTGATTVYTVPANSAVKIATCVIANISASPLVGVTVSVVPSGGSVDGTHVIATIGTAAQPFAAGDSTSLFELAGAMLDSGALISITSPAATSINFLITGAVAS